MTQVMADAAMSHHLHARARLRYFAEAMRFISKRELKKRLASQKPDNEHPTEGYALVYVMSRAWYLDQHIPYSLNIQAGDEDEFERKFAKTKEIIVYCKSLTSEASERTVAELERRGFMKVVRYAGGIKEWSYEQGDRP